MTPAAASVAQVLDLTLAQRPDAPAVAARSGALTYRELDRRIDDAAGGLWEFGVRPGDRVAATLPNDLDIVVAFHATMRLGAIWVGVPTALAAAEQARLLTHCDPLVYLCDPVTADRLDGDGFTTPPRLVVDPTHPASDWSEHMAARHRAPRPRIDPHAPAGIAYTSGTTGTPKGVVHSQHNLLLPGAALTATRGYGPGLRKGDCLPLTILNLMVLTTLLSAQAGGCCVVMDRRDAHGIVEWIREQRITVWNGVPAQLWDMVRRSDIAPDDLVGLTEIWCGGADLPDALRDEFNAKFHLPIRATYGLTEAPTVVAIDPPGARWQPGAGGIVLPHLNVAVSDGELTLSAATEGPWAHRYTPMLGHWDNGTVTPAGETLSTGDLGTVDAGGWLRVLGRRKLLIVRGGANVYPTEVEHVIKTVPGVRDVVVFGLPDSRLGERVAAIVETPLPADDPSLSAERLRRHCAAELAAYKVPEAWAVVEDIPRNAMGKIIRTQLSELFATATRLDSPAHV